MIHIALSRTEVDLSQPSSGMSQTQGNMVANVEIANELPLISAQKHPLRAVRSLSIDEVIVKYEDKMNNARKAINTLQTQVGTTIISSSSGSEYEIDEGTKTIETEQYYPTFAKKYTFKTNVCKKNIHIPM